MNKYMDNLMERAKRNNPPAPGDYHGDDGLLRCGKCGEKKEDLIDGERRTIPCRCRHEEKARADLEKAMKEHDALRDKCFTSPALKTFRIENAGEGKAVDLVRRYIANWERVKADNIGLLLWGGIGTGKSFLAACVANAIIDAGGNARMRTAGDFILEIQDSEKKMAYLNDLCDKQLLILDDLGTERNTGFGAEVIYTLIDRRYQTGKPLIVTTNISLPEMKECAELGKSRLYSRILDICCPIKVDGPDRREARAAERMRSAKEIFGVV